MIAVPFSFRTGTNLMPKTLFVVNPNAGSGRGRKTWERVQPLLYEEAHNTFSVIMTKYPEDVIDCVDQAIDENFEQIITIGGDGTTHALVNALMVAREEHPYAHKLIFGSIPAGTGRDFARGAGLPLHTDQAIHYVLNEAKPRPIDVGVVTFDGEKQWFLNISSAGISLDVVQGVESNTKRPWSFLMAILGSLRGYTPEVMRIEVNGECWYEGDTYITAVANGRYFGQGLLVAPEAKNDDGLFNVIIAEGMPRFAVLRLLPKVYSGKHLQHPKVHQTHAEKVAIITLTGEPIGMELDGEPAQSGKVIEYAIVPGALQMLL